MLLKMKKIEERVAAERRKAAAEERLAIAEDKRTTAKQRKVEELEERKAAAEELKEPRRKKKIKIMFMDTSGLHAMQKAYVELCKDQMLARKFMMMMNVNMMGGSMGGAMDGDM